MQITYKILIQLSEILYNQPVLDTFITENKFKLDTNKIIENKSFNPDRFHEII